MSLITYNAKERTLPFRSSTEGSEQLRMREGAAAAGPSTERRRTPNRANKKQPTKEGRGMDGPAERKKEGAGNRTERAERKKEKKKAQ